MNILRSFDMFGLPIPAFNIKGQDKIKTKVGGLLSALVMTLTLGYAITGIYDIKNKANPIIN